MTFTCFGGFLLGGSNAEKWSDHWKKEFFIKNYSAEAPIPLKEGHQGLLKQQVHLHEGINISGGGGAEGLQFGEKMGLWTYLNLVYFLEWAWRVQMKK